MLTLKSNVITFTGQKHGSWRGDVWWYNLWVVLPLPTLDILWGNLHATDLCTRQCQIVNHIAGHCRDHQSTISTCLVIYEAKVPCIYGGCCPFWAAVCKGHSSGTHLFVLKVHVHLKHVIQGVTRWGLLWLRRNVYLMRGFNSVLRVAFFWSVDYGYWWFHFGCTFARLWGTSSKNERCWKSSSPGAMSFFWADWRSRLLSSFLWFDWQNSIIWHFSIQKIALCFRY